MELQPPIVSPLPVAISDSSTDSESSASSVFETAIVDRNSGSISARPPQNPGRNFLFGSVSDGDEENQLLISRKNSEAVSIGVCENSSDNASGANRPARPIVHFRKA